MAARQPGTALSELAILVPVLRRPHRVAPLVRSVAAATPHARVLFLVDPGDDAECAAIRRERRASSLRIDAVAHAGNYASKINHGIRLTGEPWLLLGADDLDFRRGWFEAAKRRCGEGIGVVGTQDLGNSRVLAGEHATHPLVARWYTELGTVDEPDRLLHEGYDHNWVDTELVETAKSRGAWAFADDAVIEHLHPLWGKAESDEVYARGQRRFRQDRLRFVKRRPLWR